MKYLKKYVKNITKQLQKQTNRVELYKQWWQFSLKISGNKTQMLQVIIWHLGRYLNLYFII